LGVEGRSLRRNAPTLLNVAYYTSLFLDGRATSLEAQAWDPLLAENEMANPSVDAVATRVASLPDYAGPFAAAFPGKAPDRATIGGAFAAYERSLVAGGSRFDRWWFGGEADAVTAEEREGFALFRFRAGCAQCHTVGDRDAAFTDQRFHNIGTGRARVAAAAAPVRVELIPGLATSVTPAALATFGEAPPLDDGRMEVSKEPADRWKYRTPSLRNVALTAPYMHDGSLATLEAVVEFYDRGGGGDPDKAEWLFPLGLTAAEKAALVAFLKTLTGANAAALAAEARR
jgi:cytochrome c peroxidase